MKVPTYTSQAQRTTKVAGQRMGVRMDSGAATRGARATAQATDLLASETQKYYETERLRKQRLQQMKASNESDAEMMKALEQAEKQSLTDPDAAEVYFNGEVDRIRETYSKTFANDDERELFGIKFDGSANRYKSKVRTTARGHRIAIDHGIWAEKATSLTEKAYQWDETAMNELFGNEELGISSHLDFAVQEGFLLRNKLRRRKKRLGSISQKTGLRIDFQTPRSRLCKVT